MRVVFIGVGDAVTHAAGELVDQGHEVVIIEADAGKIEHYEDLLDCSFLHGDGNRPDILEEVGPEQTDVLICATGDDQSNILASLVGRSLGFSRVVTRIRDPALESICVKLGLEDVIIPSRTIGRSLVDLVTGAEVPELSTVLRGDSRFFLFVVDDHSAGPVAELELPQGAQVICYYRDGKFELVSEKSDLRDQDEVVVLTYSGNLEVLRDRFTRADEEEEGGGAEPES